MERQASVLQQALSDRGWSSEKTTLKPGDSFDDWINTAFANATIYVVLVPIEGVKSRLQQNEISQILEAAWADQRIRVAVVAPAVGAIPAALRNQPFVLYFPHDDARLNEWVSNPKSADQFLDALLQPTAASRTARRMNEDETIRHWRNRLLHLGRNEVIQPSPEDRERILEKLREDLESAREAVRGGSGWHAGPLLERVLVSDWLGERDLASRFYQIMPPGVDEYAKPTERSADEEYSRALAAFEVGASQDALASFIRAAELSEEVRTATDPRTIAAVRYAALAATDGDNKTAAKYFYERALNLALEGLGTSHPQTATIAFEFGKYMAGVGETSEALRLFRLAKQVYQLSTPPDSPELTSVAREMRQLEG